MKKNAIFPFAAALFFLAGCVSVKTALYPNANYLPTDPKKVQILRNFPPNPAGYEVIGEVYVPEMNNENSPFLENKLRKKIAEAGGHAVVIIKQFESTQASVGLPSGPAATFQSGKNSGLNIGVPSVAIPSAPASQGGAQTVLPSFYLSQSFSGRGYILRYRKV